MGKDVDNYRVTNTTNLHIDIFLIYMDFQKSVQTIGEEQTQNPYTELLVLKGHHDIVRFLVAVDNCR